MLDSSNECSFTNRRPSADGSQSDLLPKILLRREDRYGEMEGSPGGLWSRVSIVGMIVAMLWLVARPATAAFLERIGVVATFEDPG